MNPMLATALGESGSGNDDDAFDSTDWLQRLRQNPEQHLADLLSQYEGSLLRMFQFRLDPRLYGRVDASDLIQETYLDARSRLERYLAEPVVSTGIWLRRVAGQTLINVHRRHLGAKMRSVRQEISLYGSRYPAATSTSLAIHLSGRRTSPSQAATRSEALARLDEALEQMDEVDREILALRHFEELSNKEAAELLGISKTAASNRYVRALKRLHVLMSELLDDRD